MLGGARIDGLRRLSGGASRETWSFDADGRPLIIQRERGAAVRSGGGMANEAALLKAASAVGVPVAPLVASGDGFVVTERLEGETIPRRLLRDAEWAAARGVLAGQCGAALRAIHSIPVDAVPGLVEQDQVAQFREILDGFGYPSPAFELGFRWLEANRPPPSTGTVVVHGDFRLGNLLVGPDGLRAVLDWEIAHLGDPMEDLGWLCVRAWRFGSDKTVAGVGEYDDLFSAYGDVDRAVVRWWEVLGTLKWGIMCLMQAWSHLSGVSRSVELAAIGRRVSEQEHDLLLLLP